MKLLSRILRIGIFLLALIVGISGVKVDQWWIPAHRASVQPPESVDGFRSEPVLAPQALPNVSKSDSQPDITPNIQDSRYRYEISDLTGDYYPDLEKFPASFLGFDHFTIETALFKDNGETQVIVPRGSLHVARITYKIEKIAIGQSQMAFQTSSINGISYKFIGQLENFPTSLDGGLPHVLGRLIKIQNGKWAGELNAEFFIEDGC